MSLFLTIPFVYPKYTVSFARTAYESKSCAQCTYTPSQLGPGTLLRLSQHTTPFVTHHFGHQTHLLCFALQKNTMSQNISQLMESLGQGFNNKDLHHASHSLKRVRFEEASNESHPGRESRLYRLNDRLGHVSRMPFLCNAAFLQSMGITFSAGDNTAAAFEAVPNEQGVPRLPIWIRTYPWQRRETIRHLMAPLGWTIDA